MCVPAPQHIKNSCNIWWIDTATVHEYLNNIKPWQRINHFPGMTNIARKGRMAQNLDSMRRQFPKDYAFCPLSFVMPMEATTFREQFDSKGKSISNRTFIVKPDAGCQGRGIYLTRKFAEVDTISSCVAQHYISKPLLIDEKKFDLRIYVLVTSCKPLRMYLFKDGLVRICTETYSKPNESNMADKQMHLTNYAINKNSEKYEQADGDDCEDASKRSIAWLKEHLAATHGEAKVNTMWNKIGHICVKTALSILPVLVREYDAKFGTGDKSGAPAENDEHTCNVLGQFGDPSQYSSSRPSTVASEVSAATADSQNSAESSNSSDKDDTTDDDDEDDSDVYSDSSSNSDDDQSSEEKAAPEEKADPPSATISGSHCFEVLGLDIMMDTKLRPYLIEVNHLPSFGTDSTLDDEIKSRVLNQVRTRPRTHANIRAHTHTHEHTHRNTHAHRNTTETHARTLAQKHT